MHVNRPARSAGAGEGEARRPIGYWAEFNNWWRTRLSEDGCRPSQAELAQWFEANAPICWRPDEMPSLQEVRTHAKCLRSTEQVRNYFRKYRAARKASSASVRVSGSDSESDGAAPSESLSMSLSALRSRLTVTGGAGQPVDLSITSQPSRAAVTTGADPRGLLPYVFGSGGGAGILFTGASGALAGLAALQAAAGSSAAAAAAAAAVMPGAGSHAGDGGAAGGSSPPRVCKPSASTCTAPLPLPGQQQPQQLLQQQNGSGRFVVSGSSMSALRHGGPATSAAAATAACRSNGGPLPPVAAAASGPVVSFSSGGLPQYSTHGAGPARSIGGGIVLRLPALQRTASTGGGGGSTSKPRGSTPTKHSTPAPPAPAAKRQATARAACSSGQTSSVHLGEYGGAYAAPYVCVPSVSGASSLATSRQTAAPGTGAAAAAAAACFPATVTSGIRDSKNLMTGYAAAGYHVGDNSSDGGAGGGGGVYLPIAAASSCPHNLQHHFQPYINSNTVPHALGLSMAGAYSSHPFPISMAIPTDVATAAAAAGPAMAATAAVGASVAAAVDAAGAMTSAPAPGGLSAPGGPGPVLEQIACDAAALSPTRAFFHEWHQSDVDDLLVDLPTDADGGGGAAAGDLITPSGGAEATSAAVMAAAAEGLTLSNAVPSAATGGGTAGTVQLAIRAPTASPAINVANITADGGGSGGGAAAAVVPHCLKEEGAVGCRRAVVDSKEDPSLAVYGGVDTSGAAGSSLPLPPPLLQPAAFSTDPSANIEHPPAPCLPISLMLFPQQPSYSSVSQLDQQQLCSKVQQPKSPPSPQHSLPPPPPAKSQHSHLSQQQQQQLLQQAPNRASAHQSTAACPDAAIRWWPDPGSDVGSGLPPIRTKLPEGLTSPKKPNNNKGADPLNQQPNDGGVESVDAAAAAAGAAALPGPVAATGAGVGASVYEGGGLSPASAHELFAILELPHLQIPSLVAKAGRRRDVRAELPPRRCRAPSLPDAAAATVAMSHAPSTGAATGPYQPPLCSPYPYANTNAHYPPYGYCPPPSYGLPPHHPYYYHQMAPPPSGGGYDMYGWLPYHLMPHAMPYPGAPYHGYPVAMGSMMPPPPLAPGSAAAECPSSAVGAMGGSHLEASSVQIRSSRQGPAASSGGGGIGSFLPPTGAEPLMPGRYVWQATTGGGGGLSKIRRTTSGHVAAEGGECNNGGGGGGGGGGAAAANDTMSTMHSRVVPATSAARTQTAAQVSYCSNVHQCYSQSIGAVRTQVTALTGADVVTGGGGGGGGIEVEECVESRGAAVGGNIATAAALGGGCSPEPVGRHGHGAATAKQHLMPPPPPRQPKSEKGGMLLPAHMVLEKQQHPVGDQISALAVAAPSTSGLSLALSLPLKPPPPPDLADYPAPTGPVETDATGLSQGPRNLATAVAAAVYDSNVSPSLGPLPLQPPISAAAVGAGAAVSLGPGDARDAATAAADSDAVLQPSAVLQQQGQAQNPGVGKEKDCEFANVAAAVTAVTASTGRGVGTLHDAVKHVSTAAGLPALQPQPPQPQAAVPAVDEPAGAGTAREDAVDAAAMGGGGGGVYVCDDSDLLDLSSLTAGLFSPPCSEARRAPGSSRAPGSRSAAGAPSTATASGAAAIGGAPSLDATPKTAAGTSLNFAFTPVSAYTTSRSHAFAAPPRACATAVPPPTTASAATAGGPAATAAAVAAASGGHQLDPASHQKCPTSARSTDIFRALATPRTLCGSPLNCSILASWLTSPASMTSLDACTRPLNMLLGALDGDDADDSTRHDDAHELQSSEVRRQLLGLEAAEEREAHERGGGEGRGLRHGVTASNGNGGAVVTTAEGTAAAATAAAARFALGGSGASGEQGDSGGSSARPHQLKDGHVRAGDIEGGVLCMSTSVGGDDPSGGAASAAAIAAAGDGDGDVAIVNRAVRAAEAAAAPQAPDLTAHIRITYVPVRQPGTAGAAATVAVPTNAGLCTAMNLKEERPLKMGQEFDAVVKGFCDVRDPVWYQSRHHQLVERRGLVEAHGNEDADALCCGPDAAAAVAIAVASSVDLGILTEEENTHAERAISAAY
ncbi:hypothetical protein VOLCADRAFT_97524 [Volvox carteri f. nagariensis]|uniref:Uncharacterized protein n=1 Tax=Volvox carteri f. nagariensis TaxID=3068 RepID=D8UCY6_VOLCA|nr:uncharacterized protein VOLCADRAFT_97524 [Volvox carteri f. nagariensis]EFJ42471.1 hypothetical protein VOLCADRAFT_97524 [Volvox carteri f. nagariensis]|eukprot:XP_002956534.1 hypothetical protein VOLCADRAFT_97524 [Volvox carteri f. nagariensis]